MARWSPIAILLMLAGCGQQELNDRIEKGLTGVRHAAKFADLDLTRFTLPNTPVSYRTPTGAPVRLTPETLDPSGSGKIPIEQINPRGTLIPGLRLVCEGQVKDDRGVSVPFDYYFAAEAKPAKPKEGETPPADGQAPAANPTPPADAAPPADAPPPDGTTPPATPARC